MKKIVLFLFFSFLLVGCGTKKGSQLAEGTAMKDIYLKVDEAFSPSGMIVTPMEIDRYILRDTYGIEPEWVSDYYGNFSVSVDNSDVFLAVSALPEKVTHVKEALLLRLGDIRDQYGEYNVNHSYDRARAGKVFSCGNEVYLIVVGIVPEEAQDLDFAEDVKTAESIIKSYYQ